MNNILLINIDDVFFTDKEYKYKKNKYFFEKKINKNLPSFNKKCVKNFKEIVKNCNFKLMIMNHGVINYNIEFWKDLFNKYEINVIFNEEIYFPSMPLFQQKNIEIKNIINNEENNKIVIYDKYFSLEKEKFILMEEKKKEYNEKYVFYLGDKRRKSIIPSTEFLYFENYHSNKKLIDAIIDVDENRGITEMSTNKIINLLT